MLLRKECSNKLNVKNLEDSLNNKREANGEMVRSLLFKWRKQEMLDAGSTSFGVNLHALHSVGDV